MRNMRKYYNRDELTTVTHHNVIYSYKYIEWIDRRPILPGNRQII
jgi:hypothetical protein